MRYGLALLEAYPERRVRTVVFCGPHTRQAPLPIDGGSLPYRLEGVLIGAQDGAATLARLRGLAAGGGAWSEADRLDLVLLPLMRQELGTEEVIRAGLELAEALPAAEQPRAMGALLALAYHYLGEAALDRLMEGLMATNLLAQVLAESMERGIAQGVEQGRAEGMEQGRAEEARVLLRRYLERHFGAIPPALDERIAGSDAETLTALFDAPSPPTPSRNAEGVHRPSLIRTLHSRVQGGGTGARVSAARSCSARSTSLPAPSCRKIVSAASSRSRAGCGSPFWRCIWQ